MTRNIFADIKVTVVRIIYLKSAGISKDRNILLNIHILQPYIYIEDTLGRPAQIFTAKSHYATSTELHHPRSTVGRKF